MKFCDSCGHAIWDNESDCSTCDEQIEDKNNV